MHHLTPHHVPPATCPTSYLCTNKIYRNPETRALLHSCAWHVATCIHPSHAKDADSKSGRILVPNEYGLCIAHHVSKHGIPPKSQSHPWPGMVTKASLIQQVGSVEAQGCGRVEHVEHG